MTANPFRNCLLSCKCILMSIFFFLSSHFTGFSLSSTEALHPSDTTDDTFCLLTFKLDKHHHWLRLHATKLSVCIRIDGSIGLKRLHVNTLIDPIELDQNEISIGLEGVFIPFLIRLIVHVNTRLD